MESYVTGVLSSIVFVVIGICLVKIASYVRSCYQFCRTLKTFPHDPMHWFFGHMQKIPLKNDSTRLKFKRDRMDRYPDGCLVWLGPVVHFVALTSSLGAEAILKTADPKGNIYRLLSPWLGDGLLLSSGAKWARNRRLLTPAFHFEILKPYMRIKNKAADVLCSKLETFAESGEYFEVFSVVSMFSLDIILQCAFSYETNCQTSGTVHPYVRSVNAMSEITMYRINKPLLHFDWIFNLTKQGREFKKHCNFVHSVAKEIISKRKQTLEKKSDIAVQNLEKKPCKDFLDILLLARDEDDVGLSDTEILDEVNTFLFEGYDTTSSAISWTLYSLAEHGNVQNRVQAEIDKLFCDRDSDDLEFSDLNKLPYLTMCIKESLRLHSVVSFILRQVSRDYEIGNSIIPKGGLAHLNIYSMHHNPSVWEDPLEFRPERFLPENIEKRNPFAYIPFSAGPRNCIGQNFAMHEMKIVLVKILKRYFIDLDPDHHVEKIESLVMKAEFGIKMKVRSRCAGQYRFTED